ncbi:MAG: hypothetical protein JXR49_18595 [Acidobacteria bacterium]|nr:hypothetical protein [Acidobacteriota bacterium]
MKLKQLIANFLTITTGIIAGFLSFAVLILLAIDCFILPNKMSRITETNPTDVQEVDASEGIPIRELGQCRIDFTEIGRRARFSGTAIYQATVGVEGVIKDLKAINGVDLLSQFVQIEQFESCVKRWRFGEEGEYSLILTAGTTGKTLEEGWKIQVRKDGKSLTVRLNGSVVPQ